MVKLVDTKFIGKKYGPTKYEVGREKIKEFAKATGDMNPRYLDFDAAEKEGRPVIAPPMFAVVYAKDVIEQMLLDRELALNLMMLVHGEQEFEFGVTVKSGDLITTEGVIKDIFNKKGKDFVIEETVSKNQNGEMTVRGLLTFVIRGS